MRLARQTESILILFIIPHLKTKVSPFLHNVQLYPLKALSVYQPDHTYFLSDQNH